MDSPMENPRPMRLTDRDLRILEAIHTYDGMLGARQIQRLFFQSWRTTRERLSLLYQNGFIARPDRRQRAALTDMVYWLAEQGAEIVAKLYGQELHELNWRKPGSRWSLTEDDLSLNWCRIFFEEACESSEDFEIEDWIPSGDFWARPDAVEYKDERGKKAKRRIRPDGYFVIRHLNKADGQWYRYRHLLELDRGSEAVQSRIARGKVLPGIAYLGSKAYEKRFGERSGRWLFVTTSERRMMNMKRQTENAAGRDAALFYLTVFDDVRPETVLTEPIWWRGGDDQPKSLFETS